MTSLAEATPSQLADAMKRRQRLERLGYRQCQDNQPPAPEPEIVALPVVEPVATPADALHVPWHDDRIVTVEMIQIAVCQKLNVTKIDMKSARRTRSVTRPRQIAMYLARKLTLRSLPDIGRRFGGRDHSTVLNAVSRVEILMAADPDFAARVTAIRDSLTGANNDH